MDAPPLDTELLRGFRFGCRPDCGLCCFTTPAVSPDEWRRVRTVRPELTTVRSGGSVVLPAHPHGGSCVLLRANRCSAHAVRPHPCREFPVTVHVGERLQASLVLSCPGLDLGGFRRDERGAEPEGLSDELAAVRARVGPETGRQLEQAVRRRRALRRRLGAEGRWEEETEVRAALREAVPTPDRDDFPSVPPPPIEGPWEALPMYFDQRAAPVALAERGDGWVAVELSAAGGGRSVGVAVPPDRPPELDVSARELLTHYLRYWLERDAFFGALHLEMLDQRPGRMREEAGRALREIGAATVTAAAVRAQLDRGVVGTLGLDDIVRGIRVVDLDWLDRPTWGGRL